MRKIIALLLGLVILTALCIISVKPVSAVSTVEDFWAPKAPMHQARGALGIVTVNGKIYAIGGSTKSGIWPVNNGVVGTNEEYDPATDTWRYKAVMPTPRIAFAIAVYQNKVYCIGGQANGSFTGVNEVYDPTTDTWESKAAMPTARGWLTANVVNGKIYGSPKRSVSM